MANLAEINSENYSSYSYIIPYIRYCSEDKYQSQWELKSRKISDYEFLFITEGSGEFIIDDNNNRKVYTVKKNDLLLLKPNVNHSGKSIDLPFKFLCIHFDLFVSKYTNNLQIDEQILYDSIPIKPIKYRKACLNLPEFISVSDSSYIQMLLKRIKNEIECKNTAFSTIIKSHFIDFMISLFRQMDINQYSKVNSPEIQQTIDYIKQNFMNKISLSDLANLIHLQSSYLSGLFKKQTGYTVTQFLKLYRVMTAKRLLLYSDKKLEDIAQSIGFYDLHHFSRVFKEIEGVTPAQYRLIKKGQVKYNV